MYGNIRVHHQQPILANQSFLFFAVCVKQILCMQDIKQYVPINKKASCVFHDALKVVNKISYTNNSKPANCSQCSRVNAGMGV